MKKPTKDEVDDAAASVTDILMYIVYGLFIVAMVVGTIWLALVSDMLKIIGLAVVGAVVITFVGLAFIYVVGYIVALIQANRKEK